tara:strand:+ start:592 stop:873 length:282 start_codon:yes stop_codon:yes gene_type:complete
MKPYLVDKKYLKIKIPEKNKNIQIQQNYNSTKLIFNFICIIIIGIGFYILYIRKINKINNQILYNHKVQNIYKEIDLLDKKINQEKKENNKLK